MTQLYIYLWPNSWREWTNLLNEMNFIINGLFKILIHTYRWMSSFKMHLQDTIDRLKKGQNVHGRVMPGRGGRSRSDTSQVRGILKRPGVVCFESLFYSRVVFFVVHVQ